MAQTQSLTAIRKHTYAGRRRAPGDTYEAEPRFAAILVKVGLAKPTEQEAARAEKPAPRPRPPSKKPQSQSYRRRDLRAEEEKAQ